MTDGRGAKHLAELMRGIGVSRGIAIGPALVIEGPDIQVSRMDLGPDSAPQEVHRLERALKEASRQLRRLGNRVQAEAGETYARVFQAQSMILEDPALVQETTGLIRREGINAEWAFRSVVRRYRRLFAQLAGADLLDRGTDIEDVETRLLAILTGTRRRQDLAGMTEHAIVVGASLSPSEAASLDRGLVIGLATDAGGPTSHTAIIASALGIPAVVGLRSASARIRTGDLVILDGREGTLLKDPSEDDLAEWRGRKTRSQKVRGEPPSLSDQSSVSRDGVVVTLRANLELFEEAETARRCGAEGVGLYRSELLYLRRGTTLPTEEDHYRLYRDLLRKFAPHEVVVRTLDLGGEKYASQVLEQREPNPVLGLRGIRLSLKREGLLRTQVRAVLRAAVHGRIRLMFPMVTAPEEIRQARAIIEAARAELHLEGIPYGPEVPVGIMIEVPVAALIADRLSREVDFFSIGTNDLIQYALAIDRGNPSVAYLYQPLHPAILELVRRVVEAAARRGLPVSVCGEMAADPVAALVLIALGVTELSMNPVAIPGVRQAIRCIPIKEVRSIVEEALRLNMVSEIDEQIRGRILALLPAEYACPL